MSAREWNVSRHRSLDICLWHGDLMPKYAAGRGGEGGPDGILAPGWGMA